MMLLPVLQFLISGLILLLIIVGAVYNTYTFNTWITDKGRQFFDGIIFIASTGRTTTNYILMMTLGFNYYGTLEATTQ
jgi:hypothetical protein